MRDPILGFTVKITCIRSRIFCHESRFDIFNSFVFCLTPTVDPRPTISISPTGVSGTPGDTKQLTLVFQASEPVDGFTLENIRTQPRAKCTRGELVVDTEGEIYHVTITASAPNTECTVIVGKDDITDRSGKGKSMKDDARYTWTYGTVTEIFLKVGKKNYHKHCEETSPRIEL